MGCSSGAPRLEGPQSSFYTHGMGGGGGGGGGGEHT